MSQSPSGSAPRKGEALSKRSYTVRLTFSAMVTACILLLIGIGWSFVLGVMVGRGYNPEKKMPQLANLLPAEEHPEQAAREKLEDSLPKGGVMKPEDLRYSSSLKGRPGQAPAEVKPKNMQNATAPVSTPPPAAVATPETAPAAAVEQKKTPPQPKEALFDYVFQVATFKDEASVDKLRAKLEGKGLRTRMNKDGRLLKVLVLLRGSAEAGQETQQLMKSMGLGQPIQRAKTPVKRR